MSTRAVVSVVIPAYNHAQWIGLAIQSVLEQTFQDWELIIIDDASTDATWEVIHTFTDPRMRVERHSTNQGAAHTLNQGLNQATGEYLAILNSDDTWHPERLEHFLALAQHQGAEFIASNARVEYSQQSTEPKWQSEFLQWYQELQSELYTSRDFLTTLVKGNFLLTTSNFFFKREVWEYLKAFQDLRYVHDYEFVLRVCEAGFLTAYSPEILLAYRQHDSNTINEAPAQAVYEHLNMLYSWLSRLPTRLDQRGWQNLTTQLTDLQTMLHGEWCAKLHSSLVQKEQVLFAIIAERDALVKQQQQWIADRDVWVKERDQVIEQNLKVIEDQHLWITERDQWVKERDQLIESLEIELMQLRQSLGYKLSRGIKKPMYAMRHLLTRQGYAGQATP
ncbi:MAG: hypothetical protein RLZZ422_290 [Pseudomonadota bacterium]|jgi:glycosyltransferase involved in cell wall biosynthesis